ncbi:serine hydrolase [Rheinheimera texasensis]|uniref:serine hydrolase n=1 Tax=Rheinheimera texasensis TaxID=306205 RepID=UPI0032B2F1CD
MLKFSVKTLATTLLFAALLPAATAANLTPAALHQALSQKDTEFFERGFNQCDLAYLDANVSAKLKFYHDRGGFQDKQLFMQSVRQNLCSDPAHKPIRKLTAGSLRTFPLYNDNVLYGAIQHGEHEFYLREPGKADRLTGTARFTSVWLKQGDDWQLSDVLSYDHQDPVVSAPETVATSTNNKIAEPAASFIEGLLKQHQVPALGLGLINQGKLQSVRVYGELQPGVPAPANTLFKVASLTKPIVSLLTLRLVAAGKLNLDEPLARYWVDPDIKADPRHLLLTPRLVLTHQTGFANWRYLKPTKKLQFQFQPGTRHQYSGEGFEYLRKALEAKFGQPLEQLAKQYVFTPAGMTDTHFYWTPAVDEQRYARNHDAKGQLLPLEKYATANAAANLLTTVEDYSKFLLFVLAQQQEMPALYQQMQSIQVPLKANNGVGLGWEIFTGFSGGESMLLHTGKDPGVSTAAMLFPQSGNGYVIFMNDDNSMPVLEQLLPQLYLGAELWQRK